MRCFRFCAQAVRRKPDALTVLVVVRPRLPPVGIPTVCLPSEYRPPIGLQRLVPLARVPAEGNAQARVVPVLQAPLEALRRHARLVHGVAARGTLVLRVGRVEEDTGDAVHDRGRRPGDARPVAATHPDAPQAVGELQHVGAQVLRPLATLAHPRVPEVRQVAVDAPPGVTEVRALAFHSALSRHVDKLPVYHHPRAVGEERPADPQAGRPHPPARRFRVVPLRVPLQPPRDVVALPLQPCVPRVQIALRNRPVSRLRHGLRVRL